MIVLVIYYTNRPHLRATVTDYLYSFAKSPGIRSVHLNLAVRSVPPSLRQLPIDLVIFDYTFLSIRFNQPRFIRLMRRARPLRDIAAVKVAIPQDEYFNSDLLYQFITDMGVSHVFTAAEEADQGQIYGDLRAHGVDFTTVLTGYLSEERVRRIETLAATTGPRTLDIGYRGRRLPYTLGRHAQLKATIADATLEHAAAHDLRVDISTDEDDALVGDDWFRMLLKARFTLGAEGGAGIIDRDGSLRLKTERYMRAHPDAGFAEVEQACFPGLDGGISLYAISPRHLEACATRTAQILVRGRYNGVLEAGRHYIPVQPDLSDLDAALEAARDDELRVRLTEQAYTDVVASGRYTYRGLVDIVLARSLGRVPEVPLPPLHPRHERLLGRLDRADRLSWKWVAARFHAYDQLTKARVTVRRWTHRMRSSSMRAPGA